MKNLPSSHEIASPPLSDEERETMFLALFGSLNDFACRIAGRKWEENRIFNVGIERTGKFPTSSAGIADQNAYRIDTLSFVGEKCDSGDPDCPYFNAFYLTRTVSTPIEIDEVDPAHHERLFDHFLQFFPGVMSKMISALAKPADSSLLTEHEEIDVDDIAPEARFNVIVQAVKREKIAVRLGRTITYAVLENGESLEFSVNKTYEIGGTEYPLVSFDSSDDTHIPVHSPHRDNNQEEFVEDPDEKIPCPLEEQLSEDAEELVLLEDDFYHLMAKTFNQEDHGAIPYAKHIRSVRRILKQLRRNL